MAKNKQTTDETSYVRKLTQDQYVQIQLNTAITRLREAYARATKEGGKVAEDEKFYTKLREAATSTRKALGAIQEPPPKPKHPERRVLAGIGVVGICGALAFKRLRRSDTELPAYSEESTDAAGRAASTADPFFETSPQTLDGHASDLPSETQKELLGHEDAS